MFKWLLPREIAFFTYFQKTAALTIEACQELVLLASDGANTTASAQRIRELEHEADEVTRQCIEALHKTFITPIDRSDIHRLAKKLDGILDAVHQAAFRLEMYEMKDMRPEVKDLGGVLVAASREVHGAMSCLHDLKNAAEIQRRCLEIYQLEGQADAIVRRAMASMYKDYESRPILAMQWREIFDMLEKAANRCEDAANLVEGILIEAS
jgi:uncharacterized protein